MRVQRGLDRRAHGSRLPRAGEEVEVEGGVQLIRAEIAGEPDRVGQPDLPDEHARLGVAVGDRAPPAVDLVQCVSIHERVLAGWALRRLLGERRVLDEQRRRVDSHPRRAAVEPEPKNVLVLGPHIRVRPVEIGLLGREEMEIPLAGPARLVVRPRPRRPAEDRLPTVRRQLPVGPPARPEPEASPLGRSGRRRQGGTKPRVLLRDVIRDDVDDAPDPEGTRFGDQLLRLLQSSERGVDRPVVGDVVARVGHRRGVPGVEPEGIDPEFAQVRQTVEDAGEVADSVAVRVGEAPHVHLVDDCLAPPAVVCKRVAAARCRGVRVGWLRRDRGFVVRHARTIAHLTIECKS
jgi:hypothetical protein